VIGLFLVCAAQGGSGPAHASTVFGTVVDATPDCSAQKCDGLARSKTGEEAERILREILEKRPAAGAVVTATSGQVTREVVCDAKGRFRFADLPLGTYSVSARAAPAGSEGKRRVSASRAAASGEYVQLVLHAELITVSGRITDAQGQPIAGARVTGTLVPYSEVGLPETRTAVSDAQGFYALTGFEPLNLYRVAGYLNGGSLDTPDALHTQVEVQVQAKEFRQGKARTPTVPLISETQLIPARRLWQALAQVAATSGGGGWKRMKDRPLPASRGSTITGIDIVLER